MKNTFNKSIKALKRIRMTDTEKDTMRSSLMSSLGISEQVSQPVKKPLASGWYHVFWGHQMRVAYSSAFAVILIGSSVVFASEGSLPGDLLYPVKTKVAEQVERAFVSSSPEDQIAFETKLVERRFKEAEKLDTENKLDDEKRKTVAKAEIEKQIEKRYEKARKNSRTQILVAAQAPAPESDRSARTMKTADNSPVAPDAVPEAATMMMSVPVATNTPTQSEQAKEKKDDRRRDSKKSGVDSKDDDNDDDENDRSGRHSGLEKVLEDHKNIVEKLDIDHNQGSRGGLFR